MFEIFQEYLDGLFYEGYTIELSRVNPEGYKHELIQFRKNYKV